MHLRYHRTASRRAIDDGKAILFEGANGILLDINHGTYPFVTSSNTGPHGIGPGAGVPPARLGHVIGVAKAYSTRVGAGPFVSELKDETGDRIRKQGHEFGTTTGRPRRCGWFDAVNARYAVRISGATDIALMHLDTLAGFEQVGVCVAYRVGGKTVSAPPANTDDLFRAEPIIEFLPGWMEDLRSITRFDDLPATTQAYVRKIESVAGAPVSLIGVGPDRTQTLVTRPVGAPVGSEGVHDRLMLGMKEPHSILRKNSTCRESISRATIAIIMDGNGRWAKQRDWPRIRGHERGAQTVRSIVTHCARLGIEALTLYSFSTENWKRPQRGGRVPDGTLRPLPNRRARHRSWTTTCGSSTLAGARACPTPCSAEMDRTIKIK